MDFTTTCLLLSLLVSSTYSLNPLPFQSHSSNLPILPIYSNSKYSPFNQPKSESLLDMITNLASKDLARVQHLSSLKAGKMASAPISSGQALNIGNYVVLAEVGTPGQPMFMVFDTSNDISWVTCYGYNCRQGCIKSDTVFVPFNSSTHHDVFCDRPECRLANGFQCPPDFFTICSFNQTYGGDSYFGAFLMQESLRLGQDVLPNFTMGCAAEVVGPSVPPQGLLGLGRGSLSVLSLAGSIYSGIFSYCLPSFRSYFFSGSLKLGPSGQPKNIRTTPLLRNPHRPSLYYVNLTGVSVGRVRVPIDPNLLRFDADTGAGTIIDSGTVITRFVEPTYEAIRDEFRKQVKGPFSSTGAFDTCFDAAANAAEMPKITLHFTGLDLVLPVENSLIHSGPGQLACLAMAASPNNVNSVVNIIANLQQQNLRIMFDTVNSRVGIARELSSGNCTRNSESLTWVSNLSLTFQLLLNGLKSFPFVQIHLWSQARPS